MTREEEIRARLEAAESALPLNNRRHRGVIRSGEKTVAAMQPETLHSLGDLLTEAPDDLRYLLDRVSLLEAENGQLRRFQGKLERASYWLFDELKKSDLSQLEFVGPEEAAKWLEGTWFVFCRSSGVGPPVFWHTSTISPATRQVLEGPHRGRYTHFARLPETLPAVEERDG